MKYKKKPVVIDAFVLNDSNKDEILKWSTKERPIVVVTDDSGVKYAEIKTLEGLMLAGHGDYIIKGVEGEVYPCKDGIFHKTYEKV